MFEFVFFSFREDHLEASRTPHPQPPPFLLMAAGEPCPLSDSLTQVTSVCRSPHPLRLREEWRRNGGKCGLKRQSSFPLSSPKPRSMAICTPIVFSFFGPFFTKSHSRFFSYDSSRSAPRWMGSSSFLSSFFPLKLKFRMLAKMTLIALYLRRFLP